MRNNDYSLTIIIPLYNAEDQIKGLFHSISNQIKVDKNEIDIIIIDDGSSDGTSEAIRENENILKEYRRVKIIRNSKNKGVSKTREIAAKEATTSHAAFIDKLTRPDKDYLYELINKKKNIIIGNVYMDKQRSLWDRTSYLIRSKLYYPYFKKTFKDIELDYESYKKFKNKGGGGAMYVKLDYFREVNKLITHGKNVNDDSKLIENLAKIEPVLKTHSARIQYLNRKGYLANIKHIFNRGPKFVDYYAKPGTKFFPFIIALLFVVLINIILILYPVAFLLELALLIASLVTINIYLSEDLIDFFVLLYVFPIYLISFSSGVLKGLLLKISGRL